MVFANNNRYRCRQRMRRHSGYLYCQRRFYLYLEYRQRRLNDERNPFREHDL